jgi:hypothetical protein
LAVAPACPKVSLLTTFPLCPFPLASAALLSSGQWATRAAVECVTVKAISVRENWIVFID